jgi:hypothetical protein
MYHNRSRTYVPGLGRFLQSDPNASGLAVVASVPHGGRGAGLSVLSADLSALTGDGVHLYQYVRGNPVAGRDPTGLISLSGLGGVASFVATTAVRGVRGGLEEMLHEYSSRLESDIDWAMDWSAPDDFHSRQDSSWAGEAFALGVAGGFEDAIDEAMESTFSLPTIASALSAGGFIKKIGRAGSSRIINYKLRGQSIPKDIPGYGRVVVRYNRRGFPDFSEWVKSRAFFSHTGNRDKDFSKANALKGYHETPRGYTWHHHQNGRELQLVPEAIHDAFRHTGGHARVIP